MGMTKRTYALPTQELARFEATVPVGSRSMVLAALMRAWLEEQETLALRANLEEGCREMWDVYADTAREWEATDDALHRTVEF